MMKMYLNLLAKSFSNKKADGAADEGIGIGKIVFAIIAFLVIVSLIIVVIVFFNGQFNTTFNSVKTWMTKLNGLIPTTLP